MTSASNFYGKLGALLGKETDLVSRRALAQANFDLSDLTDKVGRTEDALAAHRQVLAAREALAAEPGADVETKVDVGRSLTAVAMHLFWAAGMGGEAVSTYRKAEALLGGLAAVAAVQTVANARLAASLVRETNANAALNEANGQLSKSRAAVQARYELATDAIKTFHSGVSEDFLLK